jgi:uncharacterized protein (DUF58 family)
MVRREEQQWQSRGSLYLDTRRSVHRGEGPGSSFEQAVSAAASIGVRLSQEGLGLRFVTDTGQVFAPTTDFEGALLDTLATVRTSTDRGAAKGMTALRTAIGSGREGDGLIIAVFGELDPAEATTVAALRRGTASCVAVLVATVEEPSPEAVRILRAAGWRVIVIDSAAALATAWAHAELADEDAGLSAIRVRRDLTS